MADPTFPYLGVGYLYEAPEYQEEIIASMQGLELWPGGVIIAPGSRPVRVGELLARLDEDVDGLGKDGQFVPRKVTRLRADPGNSVNVDVADAHPFAPGDVLVYDIVYAGTGTSFGTIASIDYSVNRIVLTSAAPTGAANNDLIGVAGATSHTHIARGIARLRNTPVAGVSVPMRNVLIIGGMVFDDIVKGSGSVAPWRHGVETTNVAGGIGNVFPSGAGLDSLAKVDLGAINYSQNSQARQIVRIRAGARSIVS